MIHEEHASRMHVPVQRTEVAVERQPPIEVQDPQVAVDEHQRGGIGGWIGPALNGMVAT